MLIALRRGKFYWQSAFGYPVKNYRRERSISYDVAIIGAGISGALSALTLSKLGYKVCLIDKHIPGRGSTLACTAILQYDTDMLLHQLREKIGKNQADVVYQEGIKAIKEIEYLAHQSKLDIDFCYRNSLLLSHNETETDILQKEVSARKELGLYAELISGNDLKERYPFNGHSAMISGPAAEVNPLLLTESILGMACEHGLDIYTDCTYSSYECIDNDTIVVRCEDNRVFTVSKLIFACGYTTSQILDEYNLGKLTSSFAGVTTVIHQNIKGWPNSEVIWEVKQPYFYLRRTNDGRVIIGGRDKPFKNMFLRDLCLPIEKKVLTNKIREFLSIKDVELEYFWCGTFGESEDSLPYIGPLPDKNNIFAILCTGGNGITFAVLATHILRDWLSGAPSDIAKLCSLIRDPNRAEKSFKKV